VNGVVASTAKQSNSKLNKEEGGKEGEN